MPVVISDNPKVIRKFIKSNGQVEEGTISDHFEGHNVGRTAVPNRVAGTAKEKSVDATPKKICLACSSPAKENSDYCSSCSAMMK